MEADDSYYVAGSTKNVIQIMQNGDIVYTIVDSSDRSVTGTGAKVYLKVTKSGAEYTSAYTREREPALDTYFYQIANIATEIENLVCNTIIIEIGGGYAGPFALTKTGATSVGVAAGYVFAGLIGISVSSTSVSASSSTYVKLTVSYSAGSGFTPTIAATTSRVTAQTSTTYEVLIGYVTVASSNITKIEQYQYGDLFIAGRVV
jgi:hypothetical protein